jgi:hypothetical protein
VDGNWQFAEGKWPSKRGPKWPNNSLVVLGERKFIKNSSNGFTWKNSF